MSDLAESGAAGNDRAILMRLPAALDKVVLERDNDARFRLIGEPPCWFLALYPGSAARVGLQPGRVFPFLDNFLADAEAFWAEGKSGRLNSGPWIELDSRGEECPLEAVALCLDTHSLLCIERLGGAYRETRRILQRARENRLAHERLARAQEALRKSEARLREALAELDKSRQDLLTILSQLQVGALLLDEEGSVVFLNEVCRSIVNKEPAQVVGKPWTRIFPFSPPVKRQLQATLAKPAHERIRLPVHLQTSKGHRYWMEVDVRDDPHNPRRRIIFLYDLSEVQDLYRLLDEKVGKLRPSGLVGNSEAMLNVYRDIADLAEVDSTVLLEGETGVGKELVAREIHVSSRRRNQPFIPLNCAGLTESLLASQLFGHKRGAFTGAVADHPGVFEAANGGTLLLDEIGDMSMAVQASLLRVLQEREIVRLGESKPRKIDVRILAATHRDLQQAVENGAFRADLLYRIRVARIRLPSLRERLEDLPLLIEAFLAQCREAIGKSVEAVNREAMALLESHTWPGNVRELRSAIEFAVIRCRGRVIQPEHLPAEIYHCVTAQPPSLSTLPGDEKQRLLAALKQADGNRTRAAQLLGMSRATLYRRLSHHGIPRLS